MDNNDYMQRVRERFYKQVKETNWGIAEEQVYKVRGRKAKPRVLAEQILRSRKEYKQVQPTKFFNLFSFTNNSLKNGLSVKASPCLLSNT